MQSIGLGHGDMPDGFQRWMDLSRPIHANYARCCDAEYRFWAGFKDKRVNPAWNRIPMFLEAFREGYDKVVWFDADVLVIKPYRNIFAETDDTSAWQMIRADLEYRGQRSWNSGVLVANNTPEAVHAFEWVWAQRMTPLEPYQFPSLNESNWIFEYLWGRPETVTEISPIWNWQVFHRDVVPESEAAILAWHGRGPSAFPEFEAAVRFS